MSVVKTPLNKKEEEHDDTKNAIHRLIKQIKNELFLSGILITNPIDLVCHNIEEYEVLQGYRLHMKDNSDAKLKKHNEKINTLSRMFNKKF